MSTITFPEAVIRFLDIRDNEEGGDCYIKANITARITKKVRESMGWGTFDDGGNVMDNWPGDGETGGGLEGSLNAKGVILVPTAKAMKNLEVNVDVNLVNTFSWKLDKSEGGGKSVIVNFIVRSSGQDEIMKLVTYKTAMGRGSATLKISYDKQEALPLEEATADVSDRQAEFVEV